MVKLWDACYKLFTRNWNIRDEAIKMDGPVIRNEKKKPFILESKKTLALPNV